MLYDSICQILKNEREHGFLLKDFSSEKLVLVNSFNELKVYSLFGVIGNYRINDVKAVFPN